MHIWNANSNHKTNLSVGLKWLSVWSISGSLIFSWKSRNSNENVIMLRQKRNYSWRSEECLAEVNGYDSDQIIIYSELARNYNLRNASGEALFYYPISWQCLSLRANHPIDWLYLKKLTRCHFLLKNQVTLQRHEIFPKMISLHKCSSRISLGCFTYDRNFAMIWDKLKFFCQNNLA